MTDPTLRFPETLERLGAAAAAARGIHDRLLARYGEAHRAYHDLDHVRACLARFDANRDLAGRPDEVEAAIWYHDAVYDPRAADNEEQSARLAGEELAGAGVPREAAERVADLVRATTHQAPPPPGDAALLVDVDLAGLGADHDRFLAEGERIRREYSFVPEARWRRGRAEFLGRLLGRERIYATERFRESLEERARSNLARLLESLRE